MRYRLRFLHFKRTRAIVPVASKCTIVATIPLARIKPHQISFFPKVIITKASPFSIKAKAKETERLSAKSCEIVCWFSHSF